MMEWPFVSRREYQRALAERNEADRCFVLAQAKLSKMEELESERDMLRTVLDDTDKAELLEALEQSTKEALALRERVEGLESGHEQIVEWSKAYPLDVFPEPDFKKAAELLKAGGMTLDAISASNMRHVVTGVGKIAKEALAAEDDLDKLTTQQKPTEEAMDDLIA